MIAGLIAITFIYSSCKINNQETEPTRFGYISGIVKNEIKDDWKTTLAKTVEYGFTEIEAVFAPDSTVSVEEVLTYCNEIGLKPIAGGINLTEDTTEAHEQFKKLKQMNLQYAVSWWPWHVSAPFKMEDCQKSARMMNFMGKIARDEYDMQLCWHNHDHEFNPMEEGTLPFDYLMQNTDPDLVKCEMDVYWVAKGGADPVEMLQKYPGRYGIIHLKDMNPTDSSITCVGNGNIDFPAILKESKRQGIKHFFVEYDKVVNGLDCLKTAGEYLKTIKD